MNDITHHILFSEQKAKTNFTQLINATVSHELRNPLNSIIAKNLEKLKLYEQMEAEFYELDCLTHGNDSIKKCYQILENLKEGCDI